jgi:hypothetical protein
MADKTWEDIKDYIEDEYPKDAGMNSDVYLRRANRGIDILNSKIGSFEGSWTNDGEDGSLVLSGATCTFPGDLLEAHIIHWANVNLSFISEARMDARDSNWRTRTGVPSYFTLTGRGLVLDSNPEADEGSDLEIWGSACIPQFDLSPETTKAANPLSYIAEPHQMAIADYVLGHLPLYDRSSKEIIAIQGDFRKQWEDFLADLSWGVIRRKYKAMDS